MLQLYIYIYILQQIKLFFLQKNNPNSPTSDDVGISIEDALNAFDFLETEYYIDGYGSSGFVFLSISLISICSFKFNLHNIYVYLSLNFICLFNSPYWWA